MRYRALDPNGDYTFGRGSGNFLVNSPECVAQAVYTRLQLWQGQWYLDKTAGTPWTQSVLSASVKNTTAVRDLAIRAVILATPGVSSIETYTSTLNPVTRALTVSGVTVQTIYSKTPVPVPTVTL